MADNHLPVAQTRTTRYNLQHWDIYDAWATVSAQSLDPAMPDRTLCIRNYQRERTDQWPLKDWSELPGDFPHELLDAMHHGWGSDTSIVSGLVVDDVIYTTPVVTRAGDFPLPRGMKFGIWSATKSAFATIACLRSAQLTGEDCRQARVADLVNEARGVDAWSEITIGDCLNMATGIGTAGPDAEPLDVFADYILEETRSHQSNLSRESYERYFAWFETPAKADKNRQCFDCSRYSWGRGVITRYRDQDLYIAGAAMDAWLKTEVDKNACLWPLVRDQVFQPCAMHHTVKLHTVEADPAESIPLTQSGLLLSLDNVARLGRLLVNGGICDDVQLLHPELLGEVFDATCKKGLATGTHTSDGEAHYHCATWHLPYNARNASTFWIPTMRGYGGQVIHNPCPTG